MCMARCTVYLSDETEERIEEILEYGDSKSGFIKQSVQEKLTREANGEHETLDKFEREQ